MSDTPETDAKWQGLCCSNLSWYHIAEKMKAYCQVKERERDEAMFKLEDWEDSAKHVRSEWPDEQHCSCVPILRKLLKDAERERDEARAELEEYRSIAEKIGATKAVSDRDKVTAERDEARELAHRFRSLYYTQLGIESSASWFPWEKAK